MESLELLLSNISRWFKPHYPELDINLIKEELDIALTEVKETDDESEFVDTLEELIEFFTIIEEQDPKRLKKKLKAFIGNLSWENFQNDPDEDGEPVKGHYSLGSMFFNKLTWIIEGMDNEEVTSRCQVLVNDIKPLMDYFENKFGS